MDFPDREPKLASMSAMTFRTAGGGWVCCDAVGLPRPSREAEVPLSNLDLIEYRPTDTFCESILPQCSCDER